MGMIKEFKEFAMKGNVIDLAVGVVIGAAFGAIVGAVVDHIIMPIVGGVDFNSLSIRVGSAELRYGMAISAVVKFIAIALFLFMVIKAINRMKKTEPPAPPPGPSSTDKLLMEIRDLLKK